MQCQAVRDQELWADSGDRHSISRMETLGKVRETAWLSSLFFPVSLEVLVPRHPLIPSKGGRVDKVGQQQDIVKESKLCDHLLPVH